MTKPFQYLRRLSLLTSILIFNAISLLGAQHASALGNEDYDKALLEKVLNGSQRSEQHKARDVYRHPLQTLAFFGVAPNEAVVEIWPGGSGWYTEILAPYLLDGGKLYAAMFSADSEFKFYRNARARFVKKVTSQPKFYSDVVVTTLEPPKYVDIAPAGGADKVLTFRNVHNWMASDTEYVVFEGMYKALKPGGVLGVVEHRAKPGTTRADMVDSGYVTEDYVIQVAQAAGFELVARSDVNDNPADEKNYPKGVWTLPPSLRLGDENKVKYLAIGESDRMTLKFIKPLRGEYKTTGQ